VPRLIVTSQHEAVLRTFSAGGHVTVAASVAATHQEQQQQQ